MILLMFISFTFISSLTFTTIKEVMVRTTALYHDGTIQQLYYDNIMELLKQAEREYVNSKNKEYNPDLLTVKLKEIEEREQEV